MIDNQRKCLHCEAKLSDDQHQFCCNGCQNAYQIIAKLGLKNYYQIRQLDVNKNSLKPQEIDHVDVSEFVQKNSDESWHLALMVQGLHCGACVWLIENILKKNPQVKQARINLTKQILTLDFIGNKSEANQIIALVTDLGYKFLPFDQEIIDAQEKRYNDSLIKALAVAGFGAGNIMLFSFALWFSDSKEMGQATRQIFQFFSAMIGLPVLVYSSQIFFVSAYKALQKGYTNMDLPISLAIFLASIVSIFQAFQGQEHVYFDSAVMLIFFLLIGRYLDMLAKKKAFNIATQFSLLDASFARVEVGDEIKILPLKKICQGMILVVASGEKIACDGHVIDSQSEVDESIICGEIVLKKVNDGSAVYAGTINMLNPIRVRVSNVGKNTMLGQIIDLISKSESSKNKWILLADKLAKIYTPAVHLLAGLTFALWYLLVNKGFQQALMNATAVLIITCPCALALAIPIVQTIVISGFISKKILIKNGEVLEKINHIDTIIFDKTGTLTHGTPKLKAIYSLENNQLQELSIEEKKFYLKIAGSLAVRSSHPIALAISELHNEIVSNIEVEEIKSFGLKAVIDKQINFSQYFAEDKLEVIIGRGQFCQITNLDKYQELITNTNINYSQLYTFMKINSKQLVFLFNDEIKEDAKDVIDYLLKKNIRVILLSGDNEYTVAKVANHLKISEFYGQQNISQKVEFVKNLIAQKKNFIMVGDGLNDAGALSLASVSISFAKASDLSKNIADVLINSNNLSPIIDLQIGSLKAFNLMRQNLIIALLYNVIALPFAMTGLVVPLVAAIAMSSSSLLVMFNSLRINKFFKK